MPGGKTLVPEFARFARKKRCSVLYISTGSSPGQSVEVNPEGPAGRSGFTAPVYSISAQKIARRNWILRSHPHPGGRYGDDWVGCTNLRAERYPPGGRAAWWRRNWWRPWEWFRFPVAHLIASMGDYPLSAHRAMQEKLREMGFVTRYHERVSAAGVRVVLVEL